MLVTHKVNDVITIKLVSGEEVIGYYVSDDDAGIVLRKPVVPVPTGQGQIGLAPFIMSSDYLTGGNAEIKFNKQAVITAVGTNKQFKDAYTQQVSGLDLSPSSKPGFITG
jgi:hypothetical protein